jgi:hypothetical protein
MNPSISGISTSVSTAWMKSEALRRLAFAYSATFSSSRHACWPLMALTWRSCSASSVRAFRCRDSSAAPHARRSVGRYAQDASTSSLNAGMASEARSQSNSASVAGPPSPSAWRSPTALDLSAMLLLGVITSGLAIAQVSEGDSHTESLLYSLARLPRAFYLTQNA